MSPTADEVRKRGPKRGGERETTPFGSELRRMRLEAGLTQAELAYCAGITPGYIGLIETGNRGSRPSIEIVRRLAQCIKLGLEDTEKLLKITGHMSEYDSLLTNERPTFEQFIGGDPRLTAVQKDVLVRMYRSWVDH